MKKKTTLLYVVALAVIVAAVSLFAACGDPKPEPTPQPTEPVLQKITVSGDYKKTYTEGESFEKSKLTVTAHYSDNTQKAVTDYTLDKEGPLQIGDNNIKVTYKGKSAFITITVEADPSKKFTVSFAENCGVTFKDGKTSMILDPDSSLPEIVDNTGKTITHWYNKNDRKVVFAKDEFVMPREDITLAPAFATEEGFESWATLENLGTNATNNANIGGNGSKPAVSIAAVEGGTNGYTKMGVNLFGKASEGKNFRIEMHPTGFNKGGITAGSKIEIIYNFQNNGTTDFKFSVWQVFTGQDTKNGSEIKTECTLKPGESFTFTHQVTYAEVNNNVLVLVKSHTNCDTMNFGVAASMKFLEGGTPAPAA